MQTYLLYYKEEPNEASFCIQKLDSQDEANSSTSSLMTYIPSPKKKENAIVRYFKSRFEGTFRNYKINMGMLFNLY